MKHVCNNKKKTVWLHVIAGSELIPRAAMFILKTYKNYTENSFSSPSEISGIN